MTYKKGMSKSKFKNKMRNFWTNYWRYERTPQEWVDSIFETTIWSNRRLAASQVPYGGKAIDLLDSALDKLVLEKKLKKEEALNMQKMLLGTEEDAYLALIVMAGLKPKKFKKDVEKLSGIQEDS